MADNYDGYVVIQRSMMRWEWFTDPATAHLFLYLILKANHTEQNYHGITIRRGELLTSYPHLAQFTGLTIRQARTAVKRLKVTGEVTCRSTNRYTLIYIVNYNIYQTQKDRQMTGKRQASDRQKAGKRQQTNMNNNVKHEKGMENIYSRPPSVAEVEAYAESEGLTINAQDFVDYNDARGWAGIKDWRPLVRFRARQTEPEKPAEDDGLDVWGKPIKKEFETI